MSTFWKAFWGSFWGKIISALFIAVCLFLGFGPDELVKYMVENLPLWITPTYARGAFLVLGFATLTALVYPWLRNKFTTAYVPLSEAAKGLYGNLRENDKEHWHTKLAETIEDTEDGILVYFAIKIALHAEIFGKRPPSDKLEKIDQAELENRGRFRNKGNEFWYYGSNEPRYIDMAVSSRKLSKVLKTLKSETMVEK